MNKMGVYIPSMGRAGRIGSKKGTADFLPGGTYVVPPDEVSRYQRAVENRGNFRVVACPAKGIAETRLWIGKHARKNGEKKFLMVDDDLLFAVRKSVDGYHLRPCTKHDIDEMLCWTENMLDKHAHASVSPRAANAGVPYLKSGDVNTLVQLNKRTLRYLAYQTDVFLKMKHGRVPVMEDFDVNLQILRSGHTNVLSYWWANDQPETGSAGGCSSYRTLELHNEAAHRLAELHAPFVTLREKENRAAVSKTAAAMKKRTEVTIYWEKAAADGGFVKEARR